MPHYSPHAAAHLTPASPPGGELLEAENMPRRRGAPSVAPPEAAAAAAPAKAPVGAASAVGSQWYRHCLEANQGAWFTAGDCFTRYAYSVMLHYWALLTYPISYLTYTWKHHLLWYGTAPGVLMFVLTVACMPLAFLLLCTVSWVKSLFEDDWTMAGPGRVFFVKPKSRVAAFFWDLYLKQSMYVGQFYLVGTTEVAIQHTWKDTVLTKDYWRRLLQQVDGRLPRELCRWDGEKLTAYYAVEGDVVVKIPDSYLGIGDSFWTLGKDFANAAELEARLRAEYAGREALVLELVRPKKSLGVHSFDILTVKNPAGRVEVLSCLLWTDCTTDSSHSCRAGYSVDVATETIVSKAAWYSPFFATMDDPLVGTKLPGVRAACEKAAAAHQSSEERWLVAVGWDAMIMEKDIVFFEGNFAGARTPRRMFLSWKCFSEFVANYAWPFAPGRSLLAHTVEQHMPKKQD